MNISLKQKMTFRFFIFILITSLVSCKSISFTDLSSGKKNENVLPALTPLTDVRNLESVYSMGTSHSAYTGQTNYILGSYVSTGASSTTYHKDKRVQDAMTIFDNEVKEAITNPIGENKGYIAFKISDGGSRTGGYLWACLSAVTLLVPNLFGMPIGNRKTSLEVIVEVFDGNKNLIGRYKAVGKGKALMALWFGYAGPEADRKGNTIALKQALQIIKDNINKEAGALNEKLNQ